MKPCCKLAEKDRDEAAKYSAQFYGMHNEPTHFCLNYGVAVAHLRYCAANDKTEEA